MAERVTYPENHEKIPPGQVLLLGEPLFKAVGAQGQDKAIFRVPIGSEEWVKALTIKKPTETEIAGELGEEYLAIGSTLKEMGVPFRIIIAHRRQLNEPLVTSLLLHLGVRGLALHQAISDTCFPRDMMVDFDGKVFVNPEANFNFPDNSGIRSPLGEGGMVLKVGHKVFLPDPQGFSKRRGQYISDIKGLGNRFQFGFLPWPQAIEINIQEGESCVFNNNHTDRVSAFIKGKDNRDYLILDHHYTTQKGPPAMGPYWPRIKEACQKLDVSPISHTGDIPYALNFEQFLDGSVLLTSGDDKLKKLLEELVGRDKVYTTGKPIIYYPLYRRGSIRCMLVFAPTKIVGSPVLSQR